EFQTLGQRPRTIPQLSLESFEVRDRYLPGRKRVLPILVTSKQTGQIPLIRFLHRASLGQRLHLGHAANSIKWRSILSFFQRSTRGLADRIATYARGSTRKDYEQDFGAMAVRLNDASAGAKQVRGWLRSTTPVRRRTYFGAWHGQVLLALR